MSSLKPLADRIVIKLDAPDTQSAGGLVLPNAQERLTGTVLAVGPGARCPFCHMGRTLTVQVGDVVLLGVNTPVQEVTIDGETVLLVREPDVLACVKTEVTK